MYSLGSEFVAVPDNMTMEIVLLFVTFICICFIAKRNLLSACIYLTAHGLYFGYYLYQNIMSIVSGAGSIE